MKKLLITAAAAAALVSVAPTISNAQGVTVDTPVGGVRIGEPGYHRHHHHDTVIEHREFRERPVRMERCRTVTIRHDNGDVKRIRKCND
jgi:hypothetical protein